jgi:hypothetical protein
LTALPTAAVTVAEMVIVIEYPGASEPALLPVEQTAPAGFNWQVQSEGSLVVGGGVVVNIMPAGVGSLTITGPGRMQGVVPMFVTVMVTVADWPLTSGFGDMDLSTERSQPPLYDADAVVWG